MLPPRIPPNNPIQVQKNGMIHPDDAIRQTDDDASSSRASAISLGYLEDPFSKLLYKSNLSIPNSGISNNRKPPLINIGTHHRTIGLDKIINEFLNSGNKNEKKQIVSLGAGSDTRFWRLMSQSNSTKISKYVEIDFPHLTSPKAQRISRFKSLQFALSSNSSYIEYENENENSSNSINKIFEISKGGTKLNSELYTLLPIDLRTSSSSSSSSTSTKTTTIKEILSEELLPILNFNLPTLFLAECLFPYLNPKESENIISWFGENFNKCLGLIYEMIGINDSFGKVMKRNLSSRNLSLPGSEPFPTPKSQADRFLNSNLGKGVFTSSQVKTLWQIREEIIDQEELQRISKLEILDEIEELKLVLEHYVIAWGVKGECLQNVGI
ncbi:uncharacterized protein I206_103081 [Kwoniella pini CBS 10737]|uniref:Leucine carboxyl methyltransferase 1 n=1 Tax=Kwoniella pini CBS 10737 TaxID=1296096 RepID=A0AAJ8L4R4_9TREE